MQQYYMTLIGYFDGDFKDNIVLEVTEYQEMHSGVTVRWLFMEKDFPWKSSWVKHADYRDISEVRVPGFLIRERFKHMTFESLLEFHRQRSEENPESGRYLQLVDLI